MLDPAILELFLFKRVMRGTQKDWQQKEGLRCLIAGSRTLAQLTVSSEESLRLATGIRASVRNKGQSAQTQEGFVELCGRRDAVAGVRRDELAKVGQVAGNAATQNKGLEAVVGVEEFKHLSVLADE